MPAQHRTYDVGYGRPPAHRRFRKGFSGNPGGRPGPRRTMEKRLQREIESGLMQSTEAMEASRPDTPFAAIARQLLLASMAGNVRAIRFTFSFLRSRGRKPPRRARLPAEMQLALLRAQAGEQRTAAPRAVGCRPSQGISSDSQPSQGDSRESRPTQYSRDSGPLARMRPGRARSQEGSGDLRPSQGITKHSRPRKGIPQDPPSQGITGDGLSSQGVSRAAATGPSWSSGSAIRASPA